MSSLGRWSVIAVVVAISLVACGGSSGGDGVSVGAPSSAKVAEFAATPRESPAAATAQGAPAEPLTQAAAVPSAIESKVSEGSQGRDVSPFKPKSGRTFAQAADVLLSSASASATPSAMQKSVAIEAFVPLKVGIPREVAQTSDAHRTQALLTWEAAELGAKVAALHFVSPGAQGLRLGVLAKSLPFGARLRFYADGADSLFEISGREVQTTVRRNTEAGDFREQAGLYWSPNLGGEAVTMEVEIPPSADPSEVVLSVPRLSHGIVDIRKLDSLLKIGESASCNLDVSCTTRYNELSKSVALMDFIGDGTGGTTAGADYVCTGTLLNDRLSTGTPYFLSAKHCIPNQTVASTLYTLWFYRSSSCGASTVSSSTQMLTTGATLLYVSPEAAAGQSMVGDTSFMRLNSAPPAGALFAGSSPIPLPYNTSVYGVHHPKGDLQKYSEGGTWGTVNCSANTCGGLGTPSAFIRVSWTAGTTEGGSSGSGLFIKMNNKDYLVGQLLGGSASCANPTGYEYYGRFDQAYSAALSQWLNAPSTTTQIPVYRFYNTGNDTHFFASTQVERDYVIQNLRSYNYEGIAFNAYSAAPAGASPVYRFYNTRVAAHFYTINDVERQSVQTNLPWYNYEGVAWYANKAAGSGTIPLYRFYNSPKQTHFYTIDAYERDYIRQNYPQYVYEDVGYYVWPK